MSITDVDWSNSEFLRIVGDITGNKRADIVGFAGDDTWVSVNLGDGTFAQPHKAGIGFGQMQGWSPSRHPRMLADLTGDGKADIIGFGDDGVWVSISKGDGTFEPARYALANFGFNQGWRVESHPRFAVDLTGDGKADIVGFGNAGVWVALNNGDGSFGEARFIIADLGVDHGWRVDQHPRFLADLTGDGRADIVAFGNDGVWVALNNGDGSFAAPRFVIANLGFNQGWRVDQHVRLLADITGDKKADIIAFGNDGIWTALSRGDGSFTDPHYVSAEMGVSKGWRPNVHPRVAMDLTGDGKADVIGFGIDGVWTALSNGDGSFTGPNFVMADMGTAKGWDGNRHPRFVADLSGDGKADLVGFGDQGVWSALSNGDGSFYGPNYVLADFGKNSGLHRRVISFDFLQKKFDTFFNHRARPIFQIKLDNPDRVFGKSTISVAIDQNNDGTAQYNFADPALEEQQDDLHFSAGLDYKFYFQKLMSSKIALTTLRRTPVPQFQLQIHFETEGPLEIKVEGHTGHDINLVYFDIKLLPELSYNNGFDLFAWVDQIEYAVRQAKVKAVPLGVTGMGWTAVTLFHREEVKASGSSEASARDAIRKTLMKRYIIVGASVDVAVWPDGTVSDEVENTFTSKIYDLFKPSTDPKKPNPFREGLKSKLTSWLLGGDYYVLGMTNDGQQLTIDYGIPPGQLEPFPEEPQTPLDPGPLAHIDHIVVLMLENRSFDHMLGYLSLDPAAGGAGRKDIDGQGPASQITNAVAGQKFLPFRITDPQFVHHTPPHSHEPVVSQINGGAMNGFASAYARAHADVAGLQPSDVLGYYDGSVLSVYNKLASEFLVCDRWFAAHPGPTFCNRFYTLTGRLNRDKLGNIEFDNFSGADFQPVQSRTVFDHLSARAVSWRYYEHRYCSLRLFSNYTFDDTNVVDFNDPNRGFVAAAKAGTLPSVTFIDPNFIDEPDVGDNDDAAPGSVLGGQRLVGTIVDALMQGPKWDKTLFVVTYDEHGGFFDHVSPMAQEVREKAAPVSGIDFYGVRVPTIVVSPWVARGQASHVVFDHTSIIKTIARRFMSQDPPDMGARVAAANDLSMVMQKKIRADKPAISIPAAPPNPPPSAHAATSPSGASTDFKEVMRFLSAERDKQKKARRSA